MSSPLCQKYYEGRSIVTVSTHWGAWQVERSELGHLKWNRFDAKTNRLSTIREENLGSLPIISDEIKNARLSDNGQILILATSGNLIAINLDRLGNFNRDYGWFGFPLTSASRLVG